MALNFAIPADRVAGLKAGIHPKTIELRYNLQRGVIVRKQFPYNEVGTIGEIGVVELNDDRI